MKLDTIPGANTYQLLDQSNPKCRKACLIASALSGGQRFSLADVPGAERPNSSLQCAIQALSGTKPCWREIHFWISWSVARGRVDCGSVGACGALCRRSS